MQLVTPQKKLHKNMILTQDGHVWAYYKVKPVFLNVHNEKDKDARKDKLEQFLMSIQRYKDFHFQMIPKQMNLKERFKDMQDDFCDETRAVANYYVNETINILNAQLGTVTQDYFVVGICMREFLLGETIQESVSKTVDSFTDSLMKAFGYDIDNEGEVFKRFVDVELELQKTISKIGGVPLTESDNIYINRFNHLRAITHSIREESTIKDLWESADSVLDPTSAGVLKVENDKGEFYIAFVPISKTPRNIRYMHLFTIAQKLPFAVELHVKGKFQDLDKVKSKSNKFSRRFKETKREANATGDSESEVNATNRFLVKRAVENTEKGVPMINWLACFVVSAKTKEDCLKKTKSLIRILKNSKIEAVKPYADQLPLFYKMLHGNQLVTDNKWVQESHPCGIAEFLFGVSSKIGNNVGYYIGRVNDFETSQATDLDKLIRASREPVFFSPFVANKGISTAKTSNPHINITGETGKGKSYLSKMISIYLTFTKAKILFIDPKCENRRWFSKVVNDEEMRRKYPLFVKLLESFNYVTLDPNNPENYGVLDPICFLEGQNAKDTAESLFEQIYPFERASKKERIFLLKSIDEVLERKASGEVVGLKTILEMFLSSDDHSIRETGELLGRLIDNSVLSLAFSDGSTKGLNLTSKVTVLEVANLQFPDKGTHPDDYEQIEKKSIAIMSLLGKFCEKFGSENPEEETAQIIDEGWVFEVTRYGQKIIKSLKRVGRSMNNMLLLSTQGVCEDEGSDDSSFGTLFAFDEPSQRDEILKHLHIENTEENKKKLASMIPGQCFYRDVYGRVGMISVHCLFEEIDFALRTVDKTATSNAEEKYAWG